MPSSEQPTEGTESSLPEGVSERTKQEFDKLLAKNKELAERLATKERQETPSVLDALRPQQPIGNSSAQEDINQLVTDEAGYVDVTLLNKTLTDAQERARRAEDEARIARERVERFEEDVQLRSTYAKYPQLDPNNSAFDETFWKVVKNELTGQMMEGRKDLLAAADAVSQYYRTTPATTQAEQETLAQREQASTIPTGAGTGVSPIVENDFIEGTRRGDSLSIGQRLKANGF